MKQPQAKDLTRALSSFVKRFDKNYPPKSEETVRELMRPIHIFMDTTFESIRVHPLWQNAPEDELDNVMESLEKYITSKFYSRIFGCDARTRELNQELTHKLQCLIFLTCDHLQCGISPKMWDMQWCDKAAAELRLLDSFKAPKDKLICLFNCVHIMGDYLSRLRGTSRGRDQHTESKEETLRMLTFVLVCFVPGEHTGSCWLWVR